MRTRTIPGTAEELPVIDTPLFNRGKDPILGPLLTERQRVNASANNS
jgi:hypothetical protein